MSKAKIIKATKLIGYDFDLGKYNSVADTLSYFASFASLSLAREWNDLIGKMSCSGGGGGCISEFLEHIKSSRGYV